MRTVADGQRIARLEGVDRHVLGAVVLEDPADVRRARDQHEIAEEDRDPDQPFDQVLDEAVLDVRRSSTLATNSGNRKNTPTPATSVRPSMSAIEPLPSSTPYSSAWTFALRISQRVPTTSVSYRTTSPRTNGQRETREPCTPESRRSVAYDDAAVRVAEGDRDRVAPAHEHALDEGLAPVRESGHGEVYRRSMQPTERSTTESERPA